ncbi:MAG: response regulator [Spirochaetales bacterium]|nr:response regulator [Spirochaetales bacterium]
MSEEKQLTEDILTGLRNDYLFRLFLPEEFMRTRENNVNSSLIAIKLDNIIEINLLHNRSGGDEALRAIAQILQNYCTHHENMAHRVFRIGGPVFFYYIPGCTPQEGRCAAEELHDLVQQSELYLRKLTISIGIVNLSEFFRQQNSPDQLALQIEMTALKRLNLAEQQGMNTICDTSKIKHSSLSDKPKILIIEPDITTIDLLIKAIEALGYEVHTCTEGESALAFIQSTPPTIIICEVMTPMINGFTIREKLRMNALWNTIPFILISHKKNEDFIQKAVDRGIKYFFRKPISITEVVGLISNITRGISY